MGFVLVLIILSVLITWVTYSATIDEDKKKNEAKCSAVVCGVMGLVIMVVIWLCSYVSYVGMEQDFATIEQYESSVQLYAEKGVAEFKPGKGMPSEFTDLKYQNYQTQIGQMIVDLRNKIRWYNEALVGKQIMKRSWFWSWCIIMPDNAKVLKMKDYLK